MDIGGLIVVSAKSSFSFGLVFIYCEFGERVTARFHEVNDSFYEMDWHLFPIETQRMMPIILSLTQQTVQIQAYGNVPAVRATFNAVIQPILNALNVNF